MKIRPRINANLMVVDVTCFRNCAAFCAAVLSEAPPLLWLCIIGCFTVCSD